MPLFKGKASKAKPKIAIDYATRPDKAVIVSSLSMDDSRDYAKQFKETCDMYGKGNGYNERKSYHFKLSIDRADNPTPEQSHELAERMAQQLFSAHECVIATHTDSDTIHSHIIVNAVSFETGKKLHLSTADKGGNGFSTDQFGTYAYCKDLADILGAEMGFTPLDWRTKTSEKLDRIFNDEAITSDQKNLSQAERNMDKHGNLSRESWKEALRQAIDEAKAHCTDRNQFQQYLQEHFSVAMPRNTGKTVSFVHPGVGETKAIRGTRLGADYTADSIDQALQRNRTLRETALLQESTERSAFNARLLTAEEQSTATGTTASTTTTIPSPTIPVIPSQPTSQAGDRKRSAPRSLSDVGAELRSLDNAVQSIAGRGQTDSGKVGRVAERGTAERPQQLNQHQQNTLQQLKQLESMNTRFTQNLSDVLTHTSDRLLAQVKDDVDVAIKSNIKALNTATSQMEHTIANVTNYEGKLKTNLDKRIKAYDSSIKKLYQLNDGRELFFWVGMLGSIITPIVLLLNLIL